METKKVFNSFLWKFFERIGNQAVTFVVSIILARILEPSAYGMIALLLAFITFADVFVTSGFGSALIQKKEADNVDFSSVFYFNIAFSVVLYFIVFFTAPAIEALYGVEYVGLAKALRVFGLQIPIASINNIQQAFVSKKMQFKSMFFSNLAGSVISGTVGIIMALCGFGYWALVAQHLISMLVYTLVLWFTVRWRPSLVFSWKRLSYLLSYGWKLLAASLMWTIYDKLRTLLIGKMYTADDLAYYNKGGQYPGLIIDNLCTAIISVLFPVMSEHQDDKSKIKSIIKSSMGVTCFIVLPLMGGLFATAEAVIKLTLTEKWLMAVPYLQLFCIIYSAKPVTQAMSQIIKAVGRTDISLKLEIGKRVFGVAVLLLTLNHGVMAIAISYAVTTILGAIADMYISGRLVGYKIFEQIKDLASTLISTLVMVIVVFLIGRIAMNYILVLLLQIVAGIAVYLLLSIITRNKPLKMLFGVITNRFGSKGKDAA